LKIYYIGKGIESLDSGKKRKKRIKTPRLMSDKVSLLEPMFNFLNHKDRDILYLIFVSCKKQNSVQKILHRSQPSLCYDIKRIKERLMFIYYLYSIFDVFIDFVENRSQEYDSEILDILTLMFYTTSFTHTAKILKKNKICVRYKFGRALRKMEDLKQWDMYEIFFTIGSNLNIIRRVYK